MSIQYSKSSFFKLRFIFHFDCELFTFMIDHDLVFFTVFTFLLLFISNLFTNLLFKCTQSLLKNLHVFNSIHFFAFLTRMTMYWRLILHASLFAYNWINWLCCTGPVITWRLTKVYIVSVVICTSKELVNGRQIDNDRNFYFSLSPGHLLTVYQAIYWLSVRSLCTGSDHDGKSIS